MTDIANTGRRAAAAIGCTATVAVTLLTATTGWSAQSPSVPPPPSAAQPVEQPAAPAVPVRMPESIRADVARVVVIAGRRPATQDVSGTYEEETRGLVGGVAAGSRIGRISKQVGPVPVNIPIPILRIPGAIFGGLSGATKRQIQEFRDALTEELAQAENNSIKDDGLALDVFWGLRKLPNLDSRLFAPTTPMPEETDAVLYVNFEDIGIDVQGKEAIITTTANATLRRVGDGQDLYQTAIHYQDRDTLKNWTENDNALWRSYANYARHFLGRELAADLFDRVYLEHQLQPRKSTDVAQDRKNEQLYKSRSLMPTLAWELDVTGHDPALPWTAQIDDDRVVYDVELYDAQRLVYAEEQVAGSNHAILIELEPCKTYRWSVRPSYRTDGGVRFGEWMRLEPPVDEDSKERSEQADLRGIVGRHASTAPAYTQDFPQLEIDCRRR